MPHAMVVDDSKAVRLLLSNVLGEIGYEVVQAGDGEDALQQLGNDPISLFLVDWNMPRMDGLEFVKRLRADQRYSSAAVMMITTETEIQQIVRALEAGANEYIMKPFTKEIIADKLRLLGVLQ